MRARPRLLVLGAVCLTVGAAGGCFNDGPGTAKVSVGLVVERCPLLTSWSASPLQATAPGGAIDVAVEGANTNDGGPTVLTYAWSASAGSFDSPTVAATVYRCTTAGVQTLTAMVTDTNAKTPCADVVSMTVTCKPPRS
jgi:hypothetical protein